MTHKKWILRGFSFVFISILFLYGNIFLSYLSNKMFPLIEVTSLIENINQITNKNLKEMCTTKWYKHFNLEFNAFSVNNFSKVMFMMDDVYNNIIQDGFYNCIFFRFGETFLTKDDQLFLTFIIDFLGTNDTLNPQPLKRIGGRGISDPHRHTLCLECSIPIEALHSNAMTINFMLSE
jgi:hypothetical protein